MLQVRNKIKIFGFILQLRNKQRNRNAKYIYLVRKKVVGPSNYVHFLKINIDI